MPLPAVCRRSWFWFLATLGWGVTLWLLSDGPVPAPEGPDIPNVDKLMHFGYFFGGAGLFSAALFLRRPNSPNWRKLIVTVVLVLALVGLLDEWHQSWIPERSGNDPGDWIADLCGAVAGAFVFRRFHRILA